MSRNINVNPGHYKVAGRERQGEAILQSSQKGAYAQQLKEVRRGAMEAQAGLPAWETTPPNLEIPDRETARKARTTKTQARKTRKKARTGTRSLRKKAAAAVALAAGSAATRPILAAGLLSFCITNGFGELIMVPSQKMDRSTPAELA